MTLIPFTNRYAKERFSAETIGGKRIPNKELDGWYGNTFNFIIQTEDGVVVFVGPSGTIGACATLENLEKLGVKELKELYLAKTGTEAQKVWQKETLITKLTA